MYGEIPGLPTRDDALDHFLVDMVFPAQLAQRNITLFPTGKYFLPHDGREFRCGVHKRKRDKALSPPVGDNARTFAGNSLYPRSPLERNSPATHTLSRREPVSKIDHGNFPKLSGQKARSSDPGLRPDRLRRRKTRQNLHSGKNYRSRTSIIFLSKRRPEVLANMAACKLLALMRRDWSGRWNRTRPYRREHPPPQRNPAHCRRRSSRSR